MKLRSFIILVTLALTFLPTAFAGELMFMGGDCRNVTFGVDGRLKMMLLQKDGVLSGKMSVSGWLCGSGSFQGSRKGNKAKFQTKDPQTGMLIDWQGTFVGDRLYGEYFVVANAASGYQREVGEWAMTVQASQVEGGGYNEKLVGEALKFGTETLLNAPVKLADQTVITGAENVFRAAHPAGKGISIEVESVDIEWKPGVKTRSLEDVHKFRTTYTLYWQGVFTPFGTTRLRMAYNAVLDMPTGHEIISSTGTTRQDFNDMAFGAGFLLGQAAMNSLLK
ncbi:MAG: hypothetical protein ACO1TE_28045 [Prosthecobacter sp.]